MATRRTTTPTTFFTTRTAPWRLGHLLAAWVALSGRVPVVPVPVAGLQAAAAAEVAVAAVYGRCRDCRPHYH